MAEKKKDEVPFEKSLARLETIVKEMESGELSLEAMMAHFEEGTRLAKTCAMRLDEVEKKIEILVKKGDAIAVEPFEPKPDS